MGRGGHRLQRRGALVPQRRGGLLGRGDRCPPQCHGDRQSDQLLPLPIRHRAGHRAEGLCQRGWQVDRPLQLPRQHRQQPLHERDGGARRMAPGYFPGYSSTRTSSATRWATELRARIAGSRLATFTDGTTNTVLFQRVGEGQRHRPGRSSKKGTRHGSTRRPPRRPFAGNLDNDILQAEGLRWPSVHPAVARERETGGSSAQFEHLLAHPDPQPEVLLLQQRRAGARAQAMECLSPRLPIIPGG